LSIHQNKLQLFVTRITRFDDMCIIPHFVRY